MVKYKRETFLSVTEHRTLGISGILCGCAAIDGQRVEKNMDEIMGGMSFSIPIIVFACLSVFLLLRGLIKGILHWKNAMERRNKYIKEGALSHGRVTDAGGGYYEKAHYRSGYARDGKSKFFRVWESEWWADVEYYDVTKGTHARRKVMGLNKNGKLHHLIGRDVDIYHLDESVYVDLK